MEEWQVEDGIIFTKIGAVGILVSVLGQVLKHSGREEQAISYKVWQVSLSCSSGSFHIFHSYLTLSGSCLRFER